MKRARIGMVAIAALAVATVAFAQAKPDFSGAWTPDQPAATAGGGAPGGGGGGGGRGGGGPMTVKQSATELSVERAGRGGGAPVTTTYKLDGTPTKITMGQMGEATATAKWDGNKLVITTKTDNGEQTQTWSLANGVLTIDSTGGRGPSTRTYKKST